MSINKKYFNLLVLCAMAFSLVPIQPAQADSTFIFNNNLGLSVTSPQVKELQKFLNANGYLVADSGPGSLNNETSFFGFKTQSALTKFQIGNTITPATGYFGPMTRGLANKIASDTQSACHPGALFSRVTGLSCAIVSIYSIGCTSSSGFSPTTGFPCRIRLSGDSGNKPSAPVIPVTKTDVPAPSAPIEVSHTALTVTLTADALNEFSKDGSIWQDSEVFTGLSASTAYTFVARVKETSTTNASPASAGTIITTDDPVVASFTSNPASGPTPLTVNFTNNTTGNPTSYLWNFGLGEGTSAATNPTHIYNTDGVFDVSLTATSSDGSNTSTQYYAIHAGTLDDASFDYTSGTYCQSGSPQTPFVTGVPGGTFSSAPFGLSLNPVTGTITLSTSALGSYLLSYLTNGASPNTSAITMTVGSVTPSASFSYSGSPFAQNGPNPSPVFSPGASAGRFTAPAGLVFMHVNTGQIDLLASTPGTYLITNTIPLSGTCGSAVATDTVTIN